MKMLPRYFSQQASRLFSVSSLIQISAPVFLPFYHVVSDQELAHIQNYPYRNARQFEKELDFLLKYFQPISLADLIENPHPTKKVFHLTFDDGLKECAEVIAPILLRKGIPASFFINTGFVNNKALFHKYKASLIRHELLYRRHIKAEKVLQAAGITRENILSVSISQAGILNQVAEMLSIDFKQFLERHQPYLTTTQLLNMKNHGFSIGAHSVNHPEFWLISPQEQLEQVRQSMAWINDNIQPGIKAFAFPFTDNGVSESVFETIRHENICDITFGTAGLKYDSVNTHFQRYTVETPGDFEQNIKAEWMYFVLRKWIGKATVNH